MYGTYKIQSAYPCSCYFKEIPSSVFRCFSGSAVVRTMYMDQQGSGFQFKYQESLISATFSGSIRLHSSRCLSSQSPVQDLSLNGNFPGVKCSNLESGALQFVSCLCRHRCKKHELIRRILYVQSSFISKSGLYMALSRENSMKPFYFLFFFKSRSQTSCKRSPDAVLTFLSSVVYLYFQSLLLLVRYFLCDRTLHSGPQAVFHPGNSIITDSV